MSTVADEFGLFEMPYLVKDRNHMGRIEKEIFWSQIEPAAEAKGYKILAVWENGFRHITNNLKPINTPADLQGIKLRTQESPTSLRMVQVLGGSPTPIAWGELYSALQQGVVDGAENNPPSFYLSRHYEVCRYYSLDEHTAVPDVLLIGTHVWEDLSQEFRDMVQESAWESALFQKKLWKQATEEALREVQKAGVSIHYPDKSLFAEKVKPLYEEYRGRESLFRLIQEIQAVK